MKYLIWLSFAFIVITFGFDTMIEYYVNKPISDIFFGVYKTLQFISLAVIMYFISESAI